MPVTEEWPESIGKGNGAWAAVELAPSHRHGVDRAGSYTIVIVTHNMAQARRASNECIFMLLGKVVEHAETAGMFVTPAKKETADYIEGRYG